MDIKAKFTVFYQKLQPVIQQLIQKFQSFLSKQAASDDSENKTGLSKIIHLLTKRAWITLVSFCLALIVIFIIWHSVSNHLDAKKVTQYVMQEIQNKPTMLAQLGNNIHPTQTGSGDIAFPALSGQMVIPVMGDKSQGKIEVDLNNGAITSLFLTKSNGDILDILQLDKLAFEESQKKALEAKLTQAFNQAVIAMQNNQLADAISGFENAITNNYRVADAYEYLGLIYSQQGNYEKCIDSFNAYISLKPDDAQAYYQMSYCYLQRMDKPSALYYLSKSCSLGNQNACVAQQQMEKEQNDLSTQLPSDDVSGAQSLPELPVLPAPQNTTVNGTPTSKDNAVSSNQITTPSTTMNPEMMPATSPAQNTAPVSTQMPAVQAAEMPAQNSAVQSSTPMPTQSPASNTAVTDSSQTMTTPNNSSVINSTAPTTPMGNTPSTVNPAASSNATSTVNPAPNSNATSTVNPAPNSNAASTMNPVPSSNAPSTVNSAPSSNAPSTVNPAPANNATTTNPSSAASTSPTVSSTSINTGLTGTNPTAPTANPNINVENGALDLSGTTSSSASPTVPSPAANSSMNQAIPFTVAPLTQQAQAPAAQSMNQTQAVSVQSVNQTQAPAAQSATQTQAVPAQEQTRLPDLAFDF
jgi:hypothetical protein